MTYIVNVNGKLYGPWTGRDGGRLAFSFAEAFGGDVVILRDPDSIEI